MDRTEVTLGGFLRMLALISAPALLVLLVLTGLNILTFPQTLYSFLAVAVLSLVIVYPFLSNLHALTDYVTNLAKDKKVEAPELSYLGAIGELSDALENLQRSWERKKQQMESVITEREILVDTLPEILIMINDDQMVVRTNRAARTIFGQNLANTHLKDMVRNDMFLNSVAAVIEDLRGREVKFRIEEPMTRDFLAIIERFPIPSAGGISTVITLNDITELKRLEQMRADFVANASHEIRTPLTSIIGFIETLLGPAKNDEKVREEFLNLMLEQAQRMQQLISDLLSLSKAEMNANTIPVGKVDILKLAEQEANNVERQADQKNMKVISNLQEDLPLARGDDKELRQIIYNLLTNAIKYGAKDSLITLSAKVTSELPPEPQMRNLSRAIIVSVQDEGEGIPPEHLSRLTERFYRVDTAHTRTIGGTGLGLSIVKHILHRHRGVLAINSTVGVGSTFSIYLPIYEDT